MYTFQLISNVLSEKDFSLSVLKSPSMPDFSRKMEIAKNHQLSIKHRNLPILWAAPKLLSSNNECEHDEHSQEPFTVPSGKFFSKQELPLKKSSIMYHIKSSYLAQWTEEKLQQRQANNSDLLLLEISLKKNIQWHMNITIMIIILLKM